MGLAEVIRRLFSGDAPVCRGPEDKEGRVDALFPKGLVPVDAKRVDVVSDTHGHISDELVRALNGADLVVHAGDITSEGDWAFLNDAHPGIKAALGNNDGFYRYDPEVPRINRFSYEGLRFAVTHYREELPLADCDVAICGHTHRPVIDQVGKCLVVNPGSASLPRGRHIPTIARLMVKDGQVFSAEIIDLV